MDRDDVRVVQRGDRLRFPLEALPPLGVGRHQTGQDLDRDLAMKARVLADENLAHAALSERLDDAVVIELRRDRQESWRRNSREYSPARMSVR